MFYLSWYCFLEICMAWKFARDFLGVKSWSRDFLFLFCFEAQEIFLGFDFCPNSIIPVT